MNITICGGGNLGHVCAGFLAAHEGHEVSLLTTRPQAWAGTVDVADCRGQVFHGVLSRISNRPEDVIPGADVVLVCLPGFAIGSLLSSIAPWLRPSCLVGTVVSSTGFFFEAFKHLPGTQPLFGFQRVPFISRIVSYGQQAELKGYKDSLSVAVEQTDDKESVRQMLQRLFLTPVRLLGSHYEVSLSNSNPLLHTSRLYTMWHDWKPGVTYDRVPGFYSEWTLEASRLYIAMDNELQLTLKSLGLPAGCIPTVLDYYESTDAASLTRKLCSIAAFQGIPSPMRVCQDGRYEPDFNSRYFTEDFPYGLRFARDVARQNGVACPHMDEVMDWGLSRLQSV